MLQKSLSYQEDGWNLAKVGYGGLLPLADGARVYPFVGGGDASCYAHACVGAQGGTECVEHLAVAVGSLDEELRLSLAPCTRFELLEALGTVSVLHGKITAEGETLSAKPRGHDGQDHAAGANERHHAYALLLGNGNDVGTRIGNGRTTGLADYTHAMPLGNGGKILGKARCVGMLAHLEEGAVVDGELPVHTAQETARGAYLLHNEVADATYHLRIVRGKHILVRCVAQGDGDEIEGWRGVIVVCHNLGNRGFGVFRNTLSNPSNLNNLILSGYSLIVKHSSLICGKGLVVLCLAPNFWSLAQVCKMLCPEGSSFLAPSS